LKTIGILGGGQLAKLLALKAKALDVKAFVLSASEYDPAAQNNPNWMKGDPHRSRELKSFLQLVDIVTFESEFFSVGHLKKTLQSLKGKKPYIAPSLKALSLIQDRWTQKKLLSQYKINTADFLKVTLKNPAKNQLLKLWTKLGPFVLKSRKGGYDGYKTFAIKKKTQIQNKSFPSYPFIAEQFIPFQRELALLSARNKKGQIVFFPLVESFQKNFRCLWVKGPAWHKKLNSLKIQIKHFLSEINYQGVLAFELFDTGDDLIVNELAPRVHNTGHYSLDALNEDQFTMHLKAIMNRPLSKPKIFKRGFAMYNLLGENSKKPFLKILKPDKTSYIYLKDELKKPALKIRDEVNLWWYGKSISRKGRKMGHINATGSSAKQALNKLVKIRTLFRV